MKRKLLILTVISVLCSLFLVLSACDARNSGSLKSLTRPYIAQYECSEATLGGENFMEKFDYIKIVLVDKENMQLVYKFKDGEKYTYESKYTFDMQTRELTAEIGLFGYRFKQSTTVEHGKFTINKTIGGKQLVLKFEAK